MDMAIGFVVINTQDILTMRIFTFPSFKRSLYFFDISPPWLLLFPDYLARDIHDLAASSPATAWLAELPADFAPHNINTKDKY